jgi:hypothetical protein
MKNSITNTNNNGLSLPLIVEKMPDEDARQIATYILEKKVQKAYQYFKDLVLHQPSDSENINSEKDFLNLFLRWISADLLRVK